MPRDLRRIFENGPAAPPKMDRVELGHCSGAKDPPLSHVRWKTETVSFFHLASATELQGTS